MEKVPSLVAAARPQGLSGRASPFPTLASSAGFLAASPSAAGQFRSGDRVRLPDRRRSGEVRGVTRREIDLAGKTWSLPSERMKDGRLH